MPKRLMLKQKKMLEQKKNPPSPQTSFKSLAIASGLSLFALAGCQTTTGISNTGSSSNNSYEEVIEEQPKTPSYNSQSQHDQQNNKTFENKDNSSNTPSNQSQTVTPLEPDQTDNNATIVTKPPSSPANVHVIIPKNPNQKTAKQILIEQARQNSSQNIRSASEIEDGENIPAFKRLMETGISQLRQGQVSAAQSTFTRAQRLAPQSSSVYFYLSQVALKQKQPLQAEAMARRGLVVAKTNSSKKALWEVILRSGQAQGNKRVINEAKAALSR